MKICELCRCKSMNFIELWKVWGVRLYTKLVYLIKTCQVRLSLTILNILFRENITFYFLLLRIVLYISIFKKYRWNLEYSPVNKMYKTFPIILFVEYTSGIEFFLEFWQIHLSTAFSKCVNDRFKSLCLLGILKPCIGRLITRICW